MTVPAPDPTVIRRHFRLLTRMIASEPTLQLEIAWGRPETGPRRAQLFRVTEMDRATEFARVKNEAGCNVYVGTTAKSPDSPSNRRTSANDAVLATCLAIDIDDNLVAGARQLPQGIRPQLLVLSGRSPALRGHLWIGLQATPDLDLFDAVAWTAIGHCGGDMAARGRAVLMRLAGTVSFPSEKKRQRGYCVEQVTGHFIDAPTYALAALASAFPRQPNGGTLRAQPLARHDNLSAFPSADIQLVQAALDTLPNSYADMYDLWIRVGLAIHAFDPSIRGLLLWRQFSERCREKAALTHFEYRWRTFGRRNTGRQITVRWLFAEARNHGWRQTCDRKIRRVRRR